MSSFLKTLMFGTLSLVLSFSLADISLGQDDNGRRGGDDGGRRGFGGGPGGFRGFGGGRGGRGFGPGGGGIIGEIENEGTRNEIGLTEDQLQQIRAIGEAASNNRQQFGDIFQRMQAAESDEEREQIRNEMRTQIEKTRNESQEQIKSILSEQQFKRLNQIQLHRAGTRALDQDEIQQELGFTDQQKEQLEAIQDERRSRFRELGFGASEEDREKLQKELEEKVLNVMTPDQRSKWQERLGPPPADAGEPRRPFGPPRGTPPTTPQQRPRPVVVEEVPEGAEVVMSFGGNAAETIDAPEGAAQLKFNFSHAPWSEVLKLFAEEAGLTLDLIDVPPGTFTYYDHKSYTPREALDVINGYLLPKGFVLVYRDEFLVSLDFSSYPIPPNLIPEVKPEDLAERGRNEMLSVVFPLDGMDAAQIAAEINEVKGPQGKVVALASTNQVFVTDIGSNLRRIQDLLLDAAGRPGPDDMTFKAYAVTNITANEAEVLVRTILNIPAPEDNSGGGDPRSRFFRSSSSSSNTTTITADQRTNQLLVSATMKNHRMIDEALKTIDVPGERSDYGGMGFGAQQMVVIPLSKMDPLVAAATIRSMYIKEGDSAPTIEADSYGRQLMVRASSNQLLEIKNLLLQLGEDGSGQRNTNSNSRVRTFPLSGRGAEEILNLIQQMRARESNSTIRIINPQDRGTIDQIKSPAGGRSVRDENPNQNPPASTQTTHPLADPQPRDSVNTKQEQKKSIPVFTASQTTVIAQATDDSQAPEEAEPQTPATTPPSGAELSDEQLLDLFEQFVNQAAPAAEPAPQAPVTNAPAIPAQSMQPPADITVTVMGDELIIVGDPNELNELESQLELAMQAIPPTTAWTVFTLQSADATETSLMLEQLLPYANVSTTTSGGGMFGSISGAASDLGSGIASMTGLSSIASAGQSLQIIPDIRLNALFVSGPRSQVKEVEEMLRVLDASEWPDSLRDKKTQLIPIQFADANDVLNIVKETYKQYIDPPRLQQSRGGNPFAALTGGGRGGNSGNDDDDQVKMAVSVDSNTNQLAVWADESLFQEVKEFVETIDRSAMVAMPTTRVIGLQNTSSTMIQSALGTLMPRVNVSSTRNRTSTSSSSSSSSGAPSSGGPSDADRERFRQMMMQRFSGGRPGGDSGGGRPSFFGGGRPGGTSGRGGTSSGRPSFFGGGRPGGR